MLPPLSKNMRHSPYTLPVHRRLPESPSPHHLRTPTSSYSRYRNIREDSNVIDTYEDAVSSHSSSSSQRIQSTVDGRWSPFGFAATELYNFSEGIPFDRATCEKNFEKLIKNRREVDYYEFLTTAQQCRQEGNPFLEKLCLQMAFTTGMNICGIDDTIKRGFSLDSANTKFDAIVQLPSRKHFQLSKLISPMVVTQWCSSSLKSSLRSFARYIFDLISEKDEDMVCYASSTAAEVYIPVGDSLISSLSDYAIEGFGQKHSNDVKAFFNSTIRSVLANKLNRLRTEYNKKYESGASEKAAKWMKSELLSPEGEFQPRELVFSQTDDIAQIEEVPVAEGYENGDYSNEFLKPQ